MSVKSFSGILKRRATLSLALLAAPLLTMGCSATDREEPGAYLYMLLGDVVETWVIDARGYGDAPIFLGHHQYLSGEVSNLNTKDFHYFRIPGSTWFQFAYPVDRPAGMKKWTYKECTYEVIGALSGSASLSDSLKVANAENGEEKYVSIQSNCGDDESYMRFLYGDIRGLVGFSHGNLEEKNGEEYFLTYDSYFLIGEFGFGSGR